MGTSILTAGLAGAYFGITQKPDLAFEARVKPVYKVEEINREISRIFPYDAKPINVLTNEQGIANYRTLTNQIAQIKNNTPNFKELKRDYDSRANWNGLWCGLSGVAIGLGTFLIFIPSFRQAQNETQKPK